MITKREIERIVLSVVENYCKNNNIDVSLDKYTALIGENRIFDSLGLVNLIVDIETEFGDKGIEISLTSEAAMSARISPFRTIGSLSNFIFKQLNNSENE